MDSSKYTIHIVSKSTEGWIGAPVLFDAYYFNSLQKLQGDEGAKKIIHQKISNVVYIDAGNLLLDIDTPETYQKLYNNI